jgi:hypothetical protein
MTKKLLNLVKGMSKLLKILFGVDDSTLAMPIGFIAPHKVGYTNFCPLFTTSVMDNIDFSNTIFFCGFGKLVIVVVPYLFNGIFPW